MDWILLLILIAIGLILLILELLVLPGGIAGIIGIGCVGAGVYLGYHYFGTPAGHYLFLATLLISILATLYALRAKTWKKLSLGASIDSAVEAVDSAIKPGDTGTTVGRLAPMGKVKVDGVTVEAQSQEGYIGQNNEVEIVKVYKDKVIVKLK